MALLDRSIKLDPENSNAHADRAFIYAEQNNLDLALADYNKAIALNPQDGSLYDSRGIFYQNLEETDLALADYNKKFSR